MGANNIHRLTATELVLFANHLNAGIPGTTPPYGITVAQKTALTNGATELTAANSAVESAKAAYRAAVQDRDTKERNCANAITTIGRTVYNSTATPAQIAALGFAPRTTERAKVVPKTPTEVTASLLPNCGVVLKWKRSGNAGSVVFRIETQTEDGPWTFLQETTACKATIYGCAPGVEKKFRIVASKNGESSVPSPTAEIYPAGSSSANFLRLAA